MNIRKIIHSQYGQYIISIMLGLGLASLFRKACKERNCLKFVGPPIHKIRNQIFEYDDQCYTFEEKAKTCSSQRKIIPFA